MSSKSGFFVFILIASGCFSKACGDGEISTSPRSYEAAPTPDQSDVDGPASDQPDVARRAGPLGDPYVHVTPADIGVTIGPGVIAPYPTINYTGPCTISENGTTIENKIINCASPLRIEANNVTIRNCVLNLTAPHNGIELNDPGRVAHDFTIEYSDVNYSDGDGKILNGFAGGDGYRNLTFRKNHFHGGFDVFYLEGDLDGMLVEYNVIGPLGCRDGEDKHADGFQIGSVNPATGTLTIRGNWIEPKFYCGMTAMFFMDHGDVVSTWESNHITVWGGLTLWASDLDSMHVRYNIYDQKWQDEAAAGYPKRAASFNLVGSHSFVCNRYESDGSFIEQSYIDGGIIHETSNCPPYTVPQ